MGCQKQMLKEFKKNKSTYTTDIGNNFLYRIYHQNFTYDNELVEFWSKGLIMSYIL